MRPRHWEDIAKVTGEQTVCVRHCYSGVMGPFDCRSPHWAISKHIDAHCSLIFSFKVVS